MKSPWYLSGAFDRRDAVWLSARGRRCPVPCGTQADLVEFVASGQPAFRTPPLSAMPVEYLTPSIEDRALEVQLLLAEKGQHRAPSIPDLLIAATAQLANLTVLHLDKDFELGAEVTGQSCERLGL